MELPGVKSGFTVGLHDKMNKNSNTDILKGLEGGSKGTFGGLGLGGSFTESSDKNGNIDPNGVSTIGINIGPTVGYGKTESNGISVKASEIRDFLINLF